MSTPYYKPAYQTLINEVHTILMRMSLYSRYDDEIVENIESVTAQIMGAKDKGSISQAQAATLFLLIEHIDDDERR